MVRLPGRVHPIADTRREVPVSYRVTKASRAEVGDHGHPCLWRHVPYPLPARGGPSCRGVLPLPPVPCRATEDRGHGQLRREAPPPLRNLPTPVPAGLPLGVPVHRPASGRVVAVPGRTGPPPFPEGRERGGTGSGGLAPRPRRRRSTQLHAVISCGSWLPWANCLTARAAPTLSTVPVEKSVKIFLRTTEKSLGFKGVLHCR